MGPVLPTRARPRSSVPIPPDAPTRSGSSFPRLIVARVGHRAQRSGKLVVAMIGAERSRHVRSWWGPDWSAALSGLTHFIRELVFPEVRKSPLSQRRISGSWLQIPMPKVVRQRPGVMSIVGELVTTGTAQHVRVNRNSASQLAQSAEPFARTTLCLLACLLPSQTRMGYCPVIDAGLLAPDHVADALLRSHPLHDWHASAPKPNKPSLRK